MLRQSGPVRVGGDLLHPDPNDCPHSNDHACPTCDFDGYYATKHGKQCPWFEDDLLSGGSNCLGCGSPVSAGCPPNPTHCGHCPPWRCEVCGEMDAPPPNSCSCWTPLAGLGLADIKAVFARAGMSVKVRR